MKKLLGIIWLSIMVSAVFGLVGYGESNVFSIRDQHVPVQLSSFEAVATAQGNVAVAWVTQSENGLIGFRVYRSELETQATAQLITPTIIPATNTSTLQRYSYSDLEVTVNKCYYYWLESVEYNTSEYFGPVSVTIEDNSVPSFPNRTYLSRAYPNPFHISSSAKIDLSVKNQETAILSIYNITGQLVSTCEVGPGTHTITWDGKDRNNQPCSSGIYLVKLRSDSYTGTSKLVLIK